MKLFKTTVILTVAALFVFVGCDKEKELEQFTNGDNHLSSVDVLFKNDVDYNLDLGTNKSTLRPNTQNISKLILNPSDSEDEKIHKYLYHLAWSVKDLMQSSEFNRTIINIAKNSEYQVALLTDANKKMNGVIDFIDKNLAKKGNIKYPELRIDENNFSNIAENFTYNHEGQTYKYNPAIYVHNLESADPNKIPIFSCGVQADSDKDKSMEDLLVAWYYTEEGEIKEILLSEEQADQMKNPLFILDNAQAKQKFDILQYLDDQENISKNRMSPVFDGGKSYNIRKVRHCKINERYERFGDSDFWITAALINESGDSEYVLKEGSSYVLNKELKKVDKRDIGNYFDVDKQFCDDPTPYSSNYVYYNTYERDWYKSQKRIGEKHHSGWGTTIYLYGKMTYSHEWYSYYPDNLYRFNLSMGWNVRSNSKSYVRIIWYTY